MWTAAPAVLISDFKERPQAMPREVSTKVADGGLRYASKKSGSPFGGQLNNTRSCIFCGTHRGPSQRKGIRFGARNEVACEPVCARNPESRKVRAALDEVGP